MVWDEQNILKRLDHPNVMKVIDFFEHKNYYVVANEIAEYGDMEKMIQDKNFRQKSLETKLTIFI